MRIEAKSPPLMLGSGVLHPGDPTPVVRLSKREALTIVSALKTMERVSALCDDDHPDAQEFLAAYAFLSEWWGCSRDRGVPAKAEGGGND